MRTRRSSRCGARLPASARALARGSPSGGLDAAVGGALCGAARCRGRRRLARATRGDDRSQRGGGAHDRDPVQELAPGPLPGRGAADQAPAPAPDLGRGRHRRAGSDHRRVWHEPGVGGPDDVQHAERPTDGHGRSPDGDPRANTRADAGSRAPHLELRRVHGRRRHPVVREEVQRQGQLGLLRHL